MTIRNAFLIFSLLFLTELGFAQIAKINALRSKESTLKSDTNEVKWHYDLSRAYRMVNIDSAVFAAQQGILVAKEIHFKKGEGFFIVAWR